ncbi:MAG: PD-(D/E)XK nuclease family protein, partial [bacterium]
DPLTRGALFHAAQFALLTELQQAKRLPLDPQNLSGALDSADAVLNRVAAEFADTFGPAIQRVWNTEVEDLRTDLRGWLQQMAAQEEWEPAYFEFAFGPVHRDAHDPASSVQEARVHCARLRGSIDLVERSRVSGHLRITDHKTGKAPDQPPVYVGGGASLQPLLYALAAEQILGAPVESSRLWYCTQRGNYSQVEISITDRARERAARVLQIVDESIAEAFLPAAPNKDACKTCDFRIVCGPYEELRTQRKPRERLDPLVELRGMP